MQLVADVVLPQRADGESNRVADGRVEFGRESLEFFVGADIDPNARTLHANQHTPRQSHIIARARLGPKPSGLAGSVPVIIWSIIGRRRITLGAPTPTCVERA